MATVVNTNEASESPIDHGTYCEELLAAAFEEIGAGGQSRKPPIVSSSTPTSDSWMRNNRALPG